MGNRPRFPAYGPGHLHGLRTEGLAIDPDGTTTHARYAYDALSRRIAKTVTDPHGHPLTTRYGWDGERLAGEATDTTTTTVVYEPASFVPLVKIEQPTDTAQSDEEREEQQQERTLLAYAADLLAAHGMALPTELEPQAPPATVSLFVTDPLGTPLALIDADGQPQWLAEADDWGAVRNEQGIRQPIRFQGQWEDEESGLYYNRYRYYDPSHGRYVTQDPIGLAGGLNTYAYALNNPVKYTDPQGLEVQLCCAPVDVSWIPDSAAAIFPKHCWLRTDTYEAGMGADCPVPGQQCSDKPGSDTTTIDHSDQSTTRKGAECTPLKNIDEQCVDERIMPGQPTGTWHPYNQCQSFAAGVMGQCRYGPNIGPDLPQPPK